jgi:high-affinity Fe2+/Pb2+ permease
LFGLGLWQHRWLTMALEFALFALAIWTYQRATRPKDKIGLYAFAGFVAVLLLAYAGASLGPAPPTMKKLALVALLAWLAIPWAWWFDKHREVV